MKKQLFIIIAGALTFATAKGELISNSMLNVKNIISKNNSIKTTKPDPVSDLTKIQFKEDFGDIKNVVWTKLKTHNGDFDKASFMWKGKATNAYYDFNNNLVGTTNFVTFKEIPDRAQKEIKEKYQDYKTENVIYFDDNEYNDTDMELYDTPFEDQDNYFVELSNSDKTIVLKIDTEGFVSYFTQIK